MVFFLFLLFVEEEIKSANPFLYDQLRTRLVYFSSINPFQEGCLFVKQRKRSRWGESPQGK